MQKIVVIQSKTIFPCLDFQKKQDAFQNFRNCHVITHHLVPVTGDDRCVSEESLSRSLVTDGLAIDHQAMSPLFGVREGKTKCREIQNKSEVESHIR